MLALFVLLAGTRYAAALGREGVRAGQQLQLAAQQRRLSERLATTTTSAGLESDPVRRADLREQLGHDRDLWSRGHAGLIAEPEAASAGSEVDRAYERLAGPAAATAAALQALLETSGALGSESGEPSAEQAAVELNLGDYLVRLEGLVSLLSGRFEQLSGRSDRLDGGVHTATALLVLIGGALLAAGALRRDRGQLALGVPNDVRDAGDLGGHLPNEHMRQCFIHAREGLVTATGDGRITTANPVAARLFAMSAKDLVGKPLTLLEALAPGTESEGVLTKFLRSGAREFQTELRALRGGGVLFPAEVSLVRIEVGDDDTVLLVVREITDRDQTVPELVAAADYQRQRNRELMARVRALEESEVQLSELESQVRHGRKLEAVGRLAGGIAHDFNNILSVLLCSNNRLRSVLAATDISRELIDEPLEEIHNSCWKAASLTRQLLAFSRRQVLHPQVLSPAALLEGLESMLRSALTEDIAFHVSSAHDLPNLRADPVHVEQVLVNLVLNARDALEGAGEIRVEADTVELVDFVDIDAEAHTGRFVRIRVTDDGKGMEPKVLELIFEPFFTTKAVGEGTGLGLASARGIVKQSGGFMAVESEQGSGTTFDVYLPAVDEEVERVVVEEEPPEVEGTGTILLCEDDEDLLRVTARTLERAGYDVISASTPERAVQCAGESHVDLLVTDLVMPGMSGRDLAERLREERPELAIVYISGYAEDVLDSHVGLDGDEEVLTKPYAAADLLGRIRDTLEAGPRSAPARESEPSQDAGPS